MSEVPENTNRRKRARTDSEKRDRRLMILDAARGYVNEKGFDAITMSGLAARTRLAKGTLYLYFTTKEEVLLNLFHEALEEWTQNVITGVNRVAGNEGVLVSMVRASQTVPLFLELLVRLTTAIEPNVNDDQLVESKQILLEQLGRIHKALKGQLGLEQEKAFALNMGLLTALHGAAHLNATTARYSDAFPAEVRALIGASRFEAAFRAAAEPMLHGLR